MNILERFGTHCTTSAPERKIDYIAIHYTAGTVSTRGAAENTAAYFASRNAKGSADFIVDDETVVQYNPDPENRYCWAVGDKNLRPGRLYKVARNDNTVSIEICSRNTTGQVRAANDLSWMIPVVERCAQEFVTDLLNALRERQLELRTAPVVFVGGGSILLKRHIERSGKVAHPMFVEDIRANVKGYETLYRVAQNNR